MTTHMHSDFEQHRLTEGQARAVYAVLVKHCGARPDEDDLAAFVYEFTKTHPTSEYRFIGGLGMGGKFRFPRISVDCYPEDNNPERAAMTAAGNEALAQLKAEFSSTAQ